MGRLDSLVQLCVSLLPTKRHLRMVVLSALVAFHAYIAISNVLAFFVVPVLAPWYVSIPIMSLILLLTFSKVIDCPLTNLENRLRQGLGLKRIGGFMGYYLLKPWRRLWQKVR